MENYHRHTCVSNIILPDSHVFNLDYCKRAVELGHKIISSCEHGTQGRYRECADLAKKYGLKWRYVAEAYFVENRELKDKTNCHIILAAKTLKGIGDLNEALSDAHMSGFYYRPRLDIEILMKLNPHDVFVTTACIGGVWEYGAIKEEYETTVMDITGMPVNKKKKRTIGYDFTKPDSLVRMLKSHFKDSFMLEIQYHNTKTQKMVNEHIKEISKSMNIPMIVGLDSHYIYENEKVLRDAWLESKKLVYEDEEGWYMDYPSDEEVINRFDVQGIFSKEEVKEAMDNTEVFMTFEDVTFDKSKKLPTIYPELTQEQRNEKYKKLISEKWNEYKKSVPADKWTKYEEGIKYEVDTITSTNTSDYFLLDYEIIKKFKLLGGRLTYTGRGSAPSYFTNTLLGFSSIDRFALPVTMYPDRFISADRLKAGSMPDIDMNVADPDIFATAQKLVVGEDRSAPMIAFGTMKRAAAWKMYCRASNVPVDIANKISASLKTYELDLKHADDDDKDSIDVLDYVPEELHEYLRMSEKYLGVIDNLSPHPCAYAVTNESIKRTFGYIRLKNDVIGAFIDGATADGYGYLKNDDLKVSVVELNGNIYKAIGMQQPTVPQLLSLVSQDNESWSMYQKGLTLGLNQAEKEKSTQKVMQYSPRNISELTAFCAGIRPGFASMAPLMFGRRKFKYNIPVLDNMLQTKEMPDSFILYQEQVMMILQYGGLTPSESYGAIKAIAKKHPLKVLPLKSRFTEYFSNRLINELNLTHDQASETTSRVWKIIEDNTAYSFNSSHACCVALDSLYTAWAKAHYPYETYAEMLKIYADNGDKKHIDMAKAEMKRGFGITVTQAKFRQDNNTYYIDKEKKTISDVIYSIKGVGKKDAQALYKLRNKLYRDFVDLLYDLSNMQGACNSGVIETLIKFDYFSEFGKAGKLMKIFNAFNKGPIRYDKALCEKTNKAHLEQLHVMETFEDDIDIPTAELVSFEALKLGTPITKDPSCFGMLCVMDIDTKYSPKITLYSLKNGNTLIFKVQKNIFKNMDLQKFDIIKVARGKDTLDKPAYTFADGKPMKIPDKNDTWLKSFKLEYRKL